MPVAAFIARDNNRPAFDYVLGRVSAEYVSFQATSGLTAQFYDLIIFDVGNSHGLSKDQAEEAVKWLENNLAFADKQPYILAAWEDPLTDPQVFQNWWKAGRIDGHTHKCALKEFFDFFLSLSQEQRTQYLRHKGVSVVSMV